MTLNNLVLMVVVVELEINMNILEWIGLGVLFGGALYFTIVTLVIMMGTLPYGLIERLMFVTGLAALVLWSAAFWLAPFRIVIEKV